MGIKETANTFHISRNTVRKYVRLFISSGKTTEQLLELSEEHLREMFGCTEFRHREPSQRQLELDALIPGYVARLSRKGMTVRKLFNEYKSEHPDGFQESVFKRAVRQYRFHTTVVGHVEHYAADQMYVDFAGDKLELVDEMTGEVRKAEVFVAILPFSHYTYCEAVWSQRKEDLIKACQNAFEYFGGVTAAIVPDNLKAAVKTSDRNEPVINEEFAAFAEHYGCAVYPARVRHPKDKALVENAVKLLYQSVYLDIEGMIFPSLDKLNTAIHISLHNFNEKLMAGRKMSRKDMFLQGERDFLRPLPEKPFVIKERKLMTVGKNCYVSIFKHHYSVPREHVGKGSSSFMTRTPWRSTAVSISWRHMTVATSPIPTPGRRSITCPGITARTTRIWRNSSGVPQKWTTSSSTTSTKWTPGCSIHPNPSAVAAAYCRLRRSMAQTDLWRPAPARR